MSVYLLIAVTWWLDKFVFQIQTVIHEVRITNQTMYLHPSIEEARLQMMQQLFAWQAIVTCQIRIQSTRYQVGLDRASAPQSYKNILTKLPEGKNVLADAYQAIENKIKQVCLVIQWLYFTSCVTYLFQFLICICYIR